VTTDTKKHYQRRFLRRDVPALFVILLLTVASFLAVRHSSFSDFIQYPSAKTALQLKENPYNPSILLKHQRNLLQNNAVDSAIMFWCPPWVLAFMPPIWFIADLNRQAYQWIIIGHIFSFISALLCYFSTVGMTPRSIWNAWVLAGVGTFCPAVLNIFTLGQSSSLLVLFGALSLGAALHGRYMLAGIAAAGLSFKPHLFLVAAFCLLLELRRSSKARKFFCGLALGLLTLALIQEISWPGSTLLWVRTLLFTEFNAETVHRGNWLSATISGFLRAMLGIASPVLSLIIPLIAVLLLGWTVARGHIKLTFLDMGWIFPVSLLCAPYGFFYDQGALLPVQFLVNACALRRQKTQNMVLALLGFHILVLFIFFEVATFHHHLWWGPIGLLVVALAIRKKSELAV